MGVYLVFPFADTAGNYSFFGYIFHFDFSLRLEYNPIKVGKW